MVDVVGVADAVRERLPAAPRPWRLPRPAWRDLIPVLLLVGIVMLTGVRLMQHNVKFSRVDEMEHFNYVTSVVDLHRIPQHGDLYNQAAMRAEACWGSQIALARTVTCTGPLDPHQFGVGGLTTIGGYPPVYYLPTAAVAAGLRPAFGFDSLFLPARLASLLWLTLGALATYLLARTLRVARGVATAVALVAALCPLMLAQGTTVNPDAMSLLAGAGSTLAWLRLRSVPGARGVLGLAAVLAAVALIKSNFLAVPVAVLVAELALTVQAQSRLRDLLQPSTWTLRRPAGRVTPAVALAGAAGVAWPFYFFVLDRSGNWHGAGGAAFGVQPWNTDLALRSLPASYTPLGEPGSFVRVLSHSELGLMTSITNLLVVSGAVAATLLSRRRVVPAWQFAAAGEPPEEPVRAVGYLAAASLVLAAPVMFAITAAVHRFIPYPSRYSLFVVPIGLVALAGLCGARRGRLFILLAAVLVAATWHNLGVL